MELSIKIQRSTKTQINADVTRPLNLPINSKSIRTLILQMAAAKLGITMQDLYLKHHYERDLKTGWTLTEGPLQSGNKVTRYTVRPATKTEQQQNLHERGGMVTNPDGSMGFWMPGEAPAPVKVKRQR